MQLISNKNWKCVFDILNNLGTCDNEYTELLAASYTFSPVTDHVMTSTSNLFDVKKAAALYYWYKMGDRFDKSILEYFDEYKRCLDDTHHEFNSNYGYYAYTRGGIKRCIDYLYENKDSRQACFCINNNRAMHHDSIDKLCTNAIQFFIRNNRLEMIVQMRSSNFLTLLPYDAFTFTVFFQHVYSYLKHSKYYDLQPGLIHMQVGSLHYYENDLKKYEATKNQNILIDDFVDSNWQINLENKLTNFLKQNI